MARGRLLLVVLLGVGVAGGAFLACGGDTGDVPAPTPDASDDGTAPPPGKDASGNDAGGGADAGGGDATADADDDGGFVSDGGSNFDAGDDDAGPLDGGAPDGGRCNTLTNDAPAVNSTCVSIAPRLGGGALVAGKYYLTGVAALGSVPFCANVFVPTSFKQTITVSAPDAGAATLDSIFVAGLGRPRVTSSTLQPGAANTSPADLTQVCPTLGMPEKVPYASAVRGGGAQELLLRLPYGNGEAVYRFTKQ